MKRGLNAGLKSVGALALSGLLSGLAGHAYPPAPHHTLYGQIRNQWGDPIDVTDATVFIQSAGQEGVRVPITPSTDPGVNYRLRVPMDSLTRADLYQASALGRGQTFTLRVQIGSTRYVPIEMSLGARAIGQPGDFTRLDLTLGVDSDGDGLPDAWEEAIIAMLGGTLASITANGDADGDGISNLNEYLTGTYAFDPGDGFRLSLLRQNVGDATLEFFAVRGRTYTVQASADLEQWTPVQFRVVPGNPPGGSPGPLQSNYPSPDVRYLQIEVPRQAGVTNRYFKALVQ